MRIFQSKESLRQKKINKKLRRGKSKREKALILLAFFHILLKQRASKLVKISICFLLFLSTCLVAHVSRGVVGLKRLCMSSIDVGTRAEERKTHARLCSLVRLAFETALYFFPFSIDAHFYT